MKRFIATLALWMLVMPAWAKTSAVLDRTRVTQGEPVVLTIATDQVGAPDYSVLQSRFRVQDLASERSVRYANGTLSVDLRYRVQLLALQPGMQTIPALVVGRDHTQPLQLEVLANTGASPSPGVDTQPQSQPAATGQGRVFIQTLVDDRHPYVQQSVGVVVRLFYATQMVDGALDLDAPAGGSLRRVGEDVQSTQELNGRTYSVIERHYILVPDRSGALTLPAARFKGHGQGGFFDDVFGDGRENLQAAGQSQVLQVRAVPANADQPWLPLHRLDMQTLGAPNSATAGQTAVVTLRAQADGANAAQLPELMLIADNGAQVYPETPTVEDRDDQGRPQTVVTRRFSVVPARAGEVHLRATPIHWWNVATDQPAMADAQPMTLQVAPGTGAFAAPATAESASSPATSPGWKRWLGSGFVWAIVAALFGLLWILTLAWASRQRHEHPVATQSPQAEASSPTPAPLRNEDLQDALRSEDLSRIAHALQRMADPPAADLDALRSRLGSTQQVDAIESLQAALWGNGRVVPASALATLRSAFAQGPQWRLPADAKNTKPLLPPLYPER